MNVHTPFTTLPEPTEAERRRSDRLRDLIRQEIDATGGISFHRFMEMALYTPELGYYAFGEAIFGEEGDFITAPVLSPLFSWCLARQAAQVLEEMGGGVIVEFGAGAGAMMVEVLRYLEREQCLPEAYWVVEISAGLRQRQRERLRRELPHLEDKVVWLDELPERFKGVVLANEILDAMPVHRLRFGAEGEHQEFFVVEREQRLVWDHRPLSDPLLRTETEKAVAAMDEAVVEGYESEINLYMHDWLRDLTARLEQGLLLLVDYGYPRCEFYHPERRMGTLMCHYRHHAHGDALILPGLQDITAHVDFTAVAEVATEAGLELEGFTTQAFFLIGCGLEQLVTQWQPEDVASYLPVSQQVKRLTLPSDMGELFKVIGLSRGLRAPLMGFSLRDQRHRL